MVLLLVVLYASTEVRGAVAGADRRSRRRHAGCFRRVAWHRVHDGTLVDPLTVQPNMRRRQLIATAFFGMLAAGQTCGPPGAESVAAPTVFPHAGRIRERVILGGLKVHRDPWSYQGCEQSLATRLVPQSCAAPRHVLEIDRAYASSDDASRHGAPPRCRHVFSGNCTWLAGRLAPCFRAKPRFFADDEAAPDGCATHRTERTGDCRSQTARETNGNESTAHPLVSWLDQLPELRTRYKRDGYVLVSGLIEEATRADAEEAVVSNL